ncbi:hypothetical protein NA78x_003030 [Anatilimnocola sp. NA78]|uniref:hypothetical protein n=1 Tax=Anatilimnocola sp. NA78 TaxID=3415683 RepID=UPI003CE45ABA
MSNPLLRPDDPRFQPKQVEQADGTNPFSEGDAVLEAEAEAGKQKKDALSAPMGAGSERPFVPQYEMTADHRAGLLLTLTSIAILGSLVAWLAAASIFYVGWLLPLFGIVPSFAVIFLAMDDLKTMHLGARNPEGRTLTILALTLSIFMTICILAGVGLMVYWGMSILPKGFLD